MYDELVNALRNNADHYAFTGHNGIMHLLTNAADAIEELTRENESLAKSVNEASEILRRRWISVTERLPDMHVEVLVCTEEYGETALGFAMVAVFDGTGWLETWERKTYLTAVTHWMPLPEPPKEGET